MSAPTPSVDRHYTHSVFSTARPPALVESVPQPWLVFEAKDDEGRLTLWKKWLEIRQQWAGDSVRWM